MSNKTGAFLAVYALEQIGVKFTFGIPGVHNTEIYDELNNSEKILPVLVTHEAGASFMADAISRSTDSIGCAVIVPAAGMTHAMSGIGEAYLDGIPMLVISGGTRRDSGRAYQLHQLDQGKILEGITKKYFLIEKHEDVIPTIYEAYRIATTGEPGPVFVEIPVELQLFTGEVPEMPLYTPKDERRTIDMKAIKAAVDMMTAAHKPGLYVGWGSVECTAYTEEIAEILAAPVATTMQGLSAFVATHPLHTGVGFGPSSPPAGQKAFKGCDAMLAIGVRFAELATGSYGVEVPENLVHLDINPEVFNANYPAKITLEGDARQILPALLDELKSRKHTAKRNLDEVAASIKQDKAAYMSEWTDKRNQERVSPGHFFEALRKVTPDDVFMVVDDGKHTFLAAELFPIHTPGHFISPTDFNCMGYSVPASIGVKLGNPEKQVVTIVGDGAFMMTGLELVTAASNGLGNIVFVFHDGELGQISQFQKIPLNRKTCTIIGNINIEGIALATGAHFISMENDDAIGGAIKEALEVSAKGKPVLVDVKIDYSKKTYLTKGVVKVNLSRFPMKQKVRFLGRAVKRHILG